MQTSYNPRPLKQVFNQDNAWEQVRSITNVKKHTAGTPKSFTALAKVGPVVLVASNKQNNG